MPCTDIHASSATAGETNSISAEHDDSPHENENDFCSPFCICSCCGQTSFMVQERQSVHKTNLIETQELVLFMYETHWESEYLDRLFHPPKV
jgi:hypothetical protein